MPGFICCHFSLLFKKVCDSLTSKVNNFEVFYVTLISIKIKSRCTGGRIFYMIFIIIKSSKVSLILVCVGDATHNVCTL